MKIKAVNVEKIQELDRLAINDYGVPSIALMENAGRSVAGEVLKNLRGLRRPQVCVVCGMGNNAGDGFVAARHLLNNNIHTKIFLIGQARDLKPDAYINYLILKKCGYLMDEVHKFNKNLQRAIRQADRIVDAIFGVGLSRDVTDPFKTIIEKLNQSGKPIIAVDIPSGLDAATGKILGACIKARKTVTFTFAKTGFFENQGPRHVGRIKVVDIGIPQKLLNLKGNLLH